MNADLRQPNPNPSGTQAEHRLQKVILRLVKGGPERLAIDAGQIDAIVDPASGTALLLPEAQRAQIERTQAAALLQERNRFARATLDALTANVAVLDSAGVVLLTNKAWRAFAATRTGLGAGVYEGANYLAACDNAGGDERLDGNTIAAGIRQVIGGERELFHHEHACATASGRRWFRLGVTGIAGSGAARAVVSSEDITRLTEIAFHGTEALLRALAGLLSSRVPAAPQGSEGQRPV